jgi:indole-3-glycerol phosphate synthase
MKKRPLIIAEVKTRSPFGYISSKSWDELFSVADEVGDMISIHTDPRWGGSFDLISKARRLTKKPILAKGIHATDAEIMRSLDNGADKVLVVGRIPAFEPEKCLIEPLTLAELKAIPANLNVVWNSRDLRDGDVKKETFEHAREIFKGWLCQASNIRSISDVDPRSDGVLVGTHIVEFAKSLLER